MQEKCDTGKANNFVATSTMDDIGLDRQMSPWNMTINYLLKSTKCCKLRVAASCVLRARSELFILRARSELLILRGRSELFILRARSELLILRARSELLILGARSELHFICKK